MSQKLFFGFILCFLMVSSYVSVSGSHWILNLRPPMQKSVDEDFNKEINETSNSNDTESNSSILNLSDMNNTVDFQPEIENSGNKSEVLEDSVTEISFITPEQPKPAQLNHTATENKNHEALPSESDIPHYALDEKIVLLRNNCNLEIPIQDTEDLKIEIEFQKLENNTFGKCCITLNGHKNTMLGVFISNIHLYHNGSQKEVIKVIIADYGSEFVLKEYYSWSKYQPLILTETHNVYIMLHYAVTDVPLSQENSHFNLEVFSYRTYENSVHHEINQSQSYFSNNYETENLSTTKPPFYYTYFKK